MSTHMRLVAASQEAAGSEESEPVAMGLGGRLDCLGLESPATTAAYAGLPDVCSCCRLLDGVGAPASGAGLLAAGVDRTSEPEDSAFLFPVTGCGPFDNGGTLLAPVVVV